MVELNRNASYYKRLYLVNDNELQIIKKVKASLEDEKAALFEAYSGWLDTHVDFKHYYEGTFKESVAANQYFFWDELILPQITDEYITKQRQIGETFASSGMPFEPYLASIAGFYTLLQQAIQRQGLASYEQMLAFHKVTSISTAVITDIYNEATSKMLTEQNQALMEMSTPVTQLWDGILLLPLVGYIDSKRAQDTMTTMLDMIAKTQSKVFILDISGVAVVDTAVANYLIRITKATRLMGCTCLISGISGSVAQTIVELGIQIDEVTTTGTMKEALNHSLELTGAMVVYENH